MQADLAAFTQKLKELGWADGRTAQIDYRWASGDVGRMRIFAKELVELHPDVIFAGGELIGKRLQFLRELAPAVARVACITSSEVWESYRRITAEHDIPPVFAPVNRSEQFDEAFATILRERADALVTEGSPIIYVQRGRIVSFAAEHRLPLATNNRESVEEGALMSYGIKASALFSDLAAYVDRNLKGASPSDLAIQRPTKFELVINARTAKALGLTVPSSLLVLADEVIE
jgi:putative ABC transport system substrate-binding protein